MNSLVSLAHANRASTPAFNGTFYAVVVTIIPVLYLAVAVQGNLLGDLVSVSTREENRVFGKISRQSILSGVISVSAGLIALAILMWGVAGEILGLADLYLQRDVGESWVVFFAVVFLTLVVAGPAAVAVGNSMFTFDPTFGREAEDPYGFYGDKAAVAVAVRAGKVLLIRRRTTKAGLLWSLPISKIEPGESPEAAAVRGTFETTGVTVTTRFVFSRLGGPGSYYIACDFVTGTINLLRLVAPDNPQAYPDRLANPEEVTKVEWCDGGQLAERVRDGIPEYVQNYLDSVLER